MANEINLKTFPCNEYEALAMHYLELHPYPGLTPEELYDKYIETYNKIRDYAKSKKKDKIQSVSY